ncbi:MAG: S24/S26 family peptidase [Clostridia bacterium]|nr:S24/S26 family peptidase [Clostridia bacterium]
MNMEGVFSVQLAELMPLIRETLAAGQTATIRIKGISMEPFLINGRDDVELAALGDRVIRVGDLLLFEREDHSFALHRVCCVYPDGRFDIVGDNQQIRDLGIPRDAVIAYVPRVWRDGREIGCDAGFWRSLMTFYMRARLRFPRVARRCMRLIQMTAHVYRDPAVIVRHLKRMGEKHEQ